MVLDAPPVVADGVPIRLAGRDFAPGRAVRLELLGRSGYRLVARTRADARGHVRFRFRPRRIRDRYRFRYGGRTLVVRSRPVTLAAVGDVNLGEVPAEAMARHGLRYPWTGTRRVLRRVDIAFGNLECAVSRWGHKVPKEVSFRGRPEALRVAHTFAGVDVFNLANNHTRDYGSIGLLDTVRWVRRFGMVGVGAGANLRNARKPRVVTRLGLRVAFVGFSDVIPEGFPAGPHRPGISTASPGTIRAGIRAARRRADVVVATFHWGSGNSPTPAVRTYGKIALDAGADAVIGAHPHVLHRIERRGRQVIAYSLGNFIFKTPSPAWARTGILRLRLSARGVEKARLQPARIVDSRPSLVR